MNNNPFRDVNPYEAPIVAELNEPRRDYRPPRVRKKILYPLIFLAIGTAIALLSCRSIHEIGDKPFIVGLLLAGVSAFVLVYRLLPAG